MKKFFIFLFAFAFITHFYADGIEIKLDKSLYQQGEMIKGEIILNLSLSEKAIFDIEWLDSYQRIVKKQTSENKVFIFNTDEAITWWNKIKVEVSEKGKLLASAEKEFDIIFKREKWDDWETMYWTSYGNDKDSKNPDVIKYYTMLKDLSAGAMGTLFFKERHLINTNTKFFVENVSFPWFRQRWSAYGKLDFGGIYPDFAKKMAKYEETKDKNLLTQGPELPCLNGPYEQLPTQNPWAQKNTIEDPKERIKKFLTKYKDYTPLYYSISDEPSITSVVQPVDLCFCQWCMAKFRNRLKGEYGDLKALNKEWETNFKNWEQVIPLTFEEAKTRGKNNYAPWADHRTFMDITFTNGLNIFKQWIKEIDSETPCGINGTERPSCYGGYDWWRLMKVIEVTENYDIGGETEIIRSFMNKDFVHLKITSGTTPKGRFVHWKRLLHCGRANSSWQSDDVITNDLTYTEQADFAKETYLELKSGICKLLYYADRVDDKIAIHYSQPSIQAAYAFFGEPPDENETSYFNDNRIALEKIIEDLGFQYKYVAYEQIEDGILTKEGYKVLVLPLSMAISKKEAIKIEEFVKNGGLVIADRMTGIMDGHCKLLKNGSLDNIFGIKRKGDLSPGTGITFSTDYKGKTFNDIPLFSGETGIKVNKGKALANWNNIPVFITNDYGQGKTVYLNLDILEYLSWRNDTSNLTGTGILKVIKEVLKNQGIERKVTVQQQNNQQELSCTEICRFKNGDLEYIGIIRNPARQDAPDNTMSEKNVKIDFGKEAYVYEIRTKKSFGLTNQVEVNFKSKEAMVFTLLPYEVSGLEITLPEKKNLGEVVEYEIKIIASVEKVGLHIIRVEVIDPDGQIYQHYSKNLLANKGMAKGKIPFAFNDKPGKWQIKVRDIASGKIFTKEIWLE